MFSIVVGTGGITPPFGLNLFALKGVAPPDISMKDIYRICLPFCGLEIITTLTTMAFPVIAKFLIR
jgi:TRAP-type mannitol/chloroaromatic compound transport system permease large subunit